LTTPARKSADDMIVDETWNHLRIEIDRRVGIEHFEKIAEAQRAGLGAKFLERFERAHIRVEIVIERHRV
jgi:hypothetical protein